MKKVIRIVIFLLIIVIAIPFINNKTSINIEELDFKNPRELEKHLGKLGNIDSLTLEQGKELIELLPNIDWDEISDNSGKRKKRDLAKLLSKVKIDEAEEVELLIDITNKFNKQDYVTVMEVLANIFIEDKELFLKALATKKGKVMELAYSFNDLKIYEREGQNLGDDFMEILNSENLTKEEKAVGYEFIEIVSSCET